jgi:hypothetical protein
MVFGAGDVMEDADKRRLKRMRAWAAKLGLSIESLRTRERVLLGFCLRDKQDRVVATGVHGLTLDEIEKEILKREKKRLRKISNVTN